MRILSPLLCLLAAVPAGCASTPTEPEVAQPAPLPAECAAFIADRVLLTIGAEVARQGATVPLRAYVPQGPYSPKQVPLTCLRGWTVNPAGSAEISIDPPTLTIAANAPAGEILTLGADAPGGFAYLTTMLVGRDELVLTGRWRQTDVECAEGPPPPEPIRELIVNAMGEYSVTWMPFETYKDYWGKARFDAAGRRLTLTVDGGNRPPVGAQLEGEASIDAEGRLILDGFHLGPENHIGPAHRCRYVFTR